MDRFDSIEEASLHSGAASLGMQARKDGKSMCSNPYYPGRMHTSWNAGWCDADMAELGDQIVAGVDAGGLGPLVPTVVIEDWHTRYMARLMEKAGLDEKAARVVLEAGMGEFDYTDDPEWAADEELSYWG